MFPRKECHALVVAMLGFATLAMAQDAPEPEAVAPLVEAPPEPVERLEQRGSWQWHVLRKDEREYVRFSDIHQFYKFETMDVIGDEVVLESSEPPLLLRFLAGMRQSQLKGYKGYLSFAPLSFKNRHYLSRVDLALLIDPVIRPSSYDFPKELVPTILLNVSADDAFAAIVASHVKSGLEAFEIKTLTALPKKGDKDEKGEEVAPAPEKLLARLHLTQHADLDELWTQSLAPYGTPVHEEKKLPANLTKKPGHVQDRLNVALGMVLHANLMENVEGILDGGLRRTRSKFLQEATDPAVSISIPAETTAAPEVLGAAIVRGIRQFRETVATPKASD